MLSCARSSNVDKVVVVAGSTGTGKTKLAVALARALDGEIISGDSMQVYKGMDIGTAKVTMEEMEGVPHHLIDIQDPMEPYDVFQFQRLCRQTIHEIRSRGHLPIICGGTGLYLKAALYDYQFETRPQDLQRRQELEQEEAGVLWHRLEQADPESARKIHPNNKKRVIRALMRAESGTTKSGQEALQQHKPIYDVFWLGVEVENNQEALKARIEEMDRRGLEEEVKRIFSDPRSWQATSFAGIGYKEWKPYLEGTATKEEVLQQIFIHTRQYARRQKTWFRHQMPMRWYHPDQYEQILQDVKGWLNGNQ